MTVVREGISRPLTNIIRPPQLDPPLGGPVEEVNRHGASAPSALVTGENGHGLLPLPCEPLHAAFPHALFPESLGMTFAQADAQEEEAEARPASRLLRFLRWGAQQFSPFAFSVGVMRALPQEALALGISLQASALSEVS